MKGGLEKEGGSKGGWMEFSTSVTLAGLLIMCNVVWWLRGGHSRGCLQGYGHVLQTVVEGLGLGRWPGAC